MTPRWSRVRILAAATVLGLGLGAIVWRAQLLQVRRHDELAAMADEQYLAQVRLPARRGTIYDRNGQVLATSVDVDSVFANPREVGSRAPRVAAELARVLGLRADALASKLGERRHFAWIKRRVTDDEARRVRQAALPGVYTVKESRRFYPNRELGAAAVGFAGIDSVGLEGVERSFDQLLRGTAEEAPALRDALGRELFPAGLPDPASRRGHDVVLTIDGRIQLFAEQALRQAVTTHHARAGWAVVTDPRTAELLAVASYPTFNPNAPAESQPGDRRNRALTDMFEPGSTAKAFSFAAAIEAGVVHEGERFFCENGAYRVGGHTVRDVHPEGWLDLAEVVAKSSNICTAKIARRTGRERLWDMLDRFGFGRRTGVELPGEAAGVLHAPSAWSEVGLANAAFGQGFAVTAVQMAAALGAIANGGERVEPRLVREVRDPWGGTVAGSPPRRHRVLAPDVALRMTALLERATQQGGTGTRAAIPAFTVAGKTGTAQKIDPVTRGYSEDRWIASFVGFAPAHAPRLLAVVVIDEPQGDLHYGGLIAAPAFRAIAEPALKYLGVPPDDDAAAPAPAQAGAHPTPAPPAAPAEPSAQAVESASEGGPAAVPDFTGMSMAEVIESARRAGLLIEMVGTGRAVGQSPGPGAPGRRVRVQFEPPG